MNNPKLSEIGRRDFLRLGSAGLLTSMFLEAGLFARTPDGRSSWLTDLHAAQPFSIGYWDVNGTHDAGLIDAAALPAGDSLLVRDGVRIRIHGIFPQNDPEIYAELGPLALEVDYRPFQPVRYRAWSLENSGVWNVSAPSSFIVPIDEAIGLQLSLNFGEAARFVPHPESNRPAEMNSDQNHIRFTLGREAGRPKLRSGIYVIALRGAQGRSLPVWRRYQWRATDPDFPQSQGDLYKVNRYTEPAPADFPCLVFSVERAKRGALSVV